MKLLLLYPPDINLVGLELPNVLEEGVGSVPPLGLLYIASIVRQYTKWGVEFIDSAAERLNYEQISQRIESSHPDAVGITVTNNQLFDCLEVARKVKLLNPAIKVIFGGAHVHIYPIETIRLDPVDFVFTGEAEYALVGLLNVWGDQDKYKTIPGLFYKTSHGIVSGQAPLLNYNLDELPFPSRELTKLELYNSPLTEEKMVTSMMTSRGCSYQCIFCARPHLGKEYRARSASNVVDEMQRCIKLGIRYIRMYDDTFTFDRKRVFNICAEIQYRNLTVKWDIRTHINTVDQEMLSVLKKSGCELICYGVESGNNEVLKRLKKGITKERALEIFGLTKKAGIKTLAYFMFGSPGETRQQMLETIEFAKSLNPDYCHFTALVPFPCTPVYIEGLREKILSGDYWRDFAVRPTLDFKPELWIEHVPEQEMRRLLKRAYDEFYLRPGYIIKQAFQVRSLGDLKRKMQTGLRLFKN